MAASAAAMRRSPATISRLQEKSAGNVQRAPAPAAPFTRRRCPLAKCAAVAVVAGNSAKGFGGTSAAPAPSKRAASPKSGLSGDDTAVKQLAETRAALREALDELAAMSAKAEVQRESFLFFFLTDIQRRRVHLQRRLCPSSRHTDRELYCSNMLCASAIIRKPSRLSAEYSLY